jgi:hypothetical protein
LTVQIEKINQLMNSVPEQYRSDWKWIIYFFATLEDEQLNDIIYDLPVSDIMAINTPQIKGVYFAEFAKMMQITSRYERKIQSTIALAEETINEFSPMGLKANLRRLVSYKLIAKRDKKLKQIGTDSSLEQALASEMAAYHVPRTFPICNALTKETDISEEMKIKALGELREEHHRSIMRFSATRRRYFRKAMGLNYRAIFDEFYAFQGKDIELNKTRIDRIVIDVYHPNLLTWMDEIKGITNDSRDLRNINFDKSKIIPRSKIDAIRAIETEYADNLDIDQLASKWEEERQEQLRRGFNRKGKIIQKHPWGKVEFTYDPSQKGAPIRLRIITNIQTLIQQELFDRHPDKEKEYRTSSWTGDSEINFILPEDYQYYYDNELITCYWLYDKAKELFYELLTQALNMTVQDPEELIIYVSQFEICWEEPFTFTKAKDGFSDFPNPALYYHLFRNIKKKLGIGNYVNFKVESKTARPSFYCDIASLDPTIPVMQYKAYPKFHHKGTAWIRQELTNTRFSRMLETSDFEDLKGINFFILNEPKYARELFEKAYWLETYNKSGAGYNNRFKNKATAEQVEYLSDRLTAMAMFPHSWETRINDIKQLNRTGKCPKTITGRPRKRMEEHGILSKQRRGSYLTTSQYQQFVSESQQTKA